MDASFIPNLSCQCCLSHTYVVFFSKESLSRVGFLSISFSYISRSFPVSNYLSVQDQSSIILVIILAFGLLVEDPS